MKDIKGYEGLYAITSCGRVWSYRSKRFLKPNQTADGYFRVELSDKGKRKKFLVHRLVAEAYIPNPNSLPIINHKDEIKTHNYINNLEWCDNKYNVSYSYGKKVKCVETGEIFNSLAEAGRYIGMSYTCITNALKRKNGTAGGYHWELW